MATYKRKPKKDSMIEIINTYSNDEDACISFFFNLKWPTGFYCEKCGCTHYLFSNTIFEGNKLPLFKLILGMYLFFSSNKGISARELTSWLDINYKSALKLYRKCRVLMTLSNSEHILDSLFYEADTAYIGAKTSNKPGLSTDQQSIFVMLSTNKENSYPKYIKLAVIPTDNKCYMTKFVKMNANLSNDRVLNTDGKTTFSELSNDIQLKSEKINYKVFTMV
ncbi:transposase [Massilimicrobiota sp. An105]|uniref:transposase n=1 Tax=Massilimicrobiota sp. An105 TaxID=1965540 RepID=UPI0019D10D4D|nr:transposase [Massilimicrobiota sp. An105]